MRVCSLRSRSLAAALVGGALATTVAPPRASADRAAPAPARALPRARSARFSWVRAAGAERCPDEGDIARAVALRLGRRPFSASAAQRVEALVAPDAARFVARIFLRDGDGTPLGERVLESEPGDCASLVGPATLAVALAIDPEASLRPQPSAATEPAVVDPSTPPAEPVACPACAPVPRVPAAAPERPRTEAVGLRGVFTAGLLPRASFGVALDAVALAYGRFALRVSAQWLPEVRTEDQRFGFGLLSLGVDACGRPVQHDRVALEGCAGAHGGALHSVVYQPTPTTPGDRAWGALTVSARASVRVAGPAWAVLSAGAFVPLVRHAFVLEGSTAVLFQQSPVTFVAGLGVALSFP